MNTGTVGMRQQMRLIRPIVGLAGVLAAALVVVGLTAPAAGTARPADDGTQAAVVYHW